MTLYPSPGPNSALILCYFYFSYQWAPDASDKGRGIQSTQPNYYTHTQASVTSMSRRTFLHVAPTVTQSTQS